MPSYKLSPYVHFVEDCLNPAAVKRGAFHQLTGEAFEVSEQLRAFLASLREEPLGVTEEELKELPEEVAQTIVRLANRNFLVDEAGDPLTPFLDLYAVRPLQNPALTYRNERGETMLVRLSMAQRRFSPRVGERPEVLEEKLEPLFADVLSLADGTKSLREMFGIVRTDAASVTLEEFRRSVEVLSAPDMQLLKVTRQNDDLGNPNNPFNTIPRNLYHAAKWEARPGGQGASTIGEFHQQGIEDAWWEFDWIEPTVNHAFRFPGDALGGLDYGSRFCLSALTPEILPNIKDSSAPIEVLEVGGGTGTFARSFIAQANRVSADLRYHILELSPALMENQKKVLGQYAAGVTHFNQDATTLDLGGRKFDLIVSNEVIADFPVAPVRRGANGAAENGGRGWEGDGAVYVERYGLPVADAPECFLLNSGVFEFVERAWHHLKPGGALLVSEYGGANQYPAQSYHLNHEEFSIHFGHVAACATRVGFECSLRDLKDFLESHAAAMLLSGREEHLLCLNHVLRRHGRELPYAALCKSDFEGRLGDAVEKLGLRGFSFSPLATGYHYGPDMKDFKILIMRKPDAGAE